MSLRKPLHRKVILAGLNRMMYDAVCAVTRIAMLFYMHVMQSVAAEYSDQTVTVDCFLQED
jgi:hypothetical protein